MKPIWFNTEMVQGILEGRKTVTRRVVRPQPEGAHTVLDCDEEAHTFDLMCGNGGEGGRFVDWAETVKAPFCPGDILYVRETWAHPSEAEIANGADINLYLYKADLLQPAAWDRWRPSIHMPKEAARIFLRVTGVRVERLQDITEVGAVSEGCMKWGKWTELEVEARSHFCNLWDSTIKPADLPLYGWEANPWVFVISFERITKDETL